MKESIYGKYAKLLPQAMHALVEKVKAFNTQYREKYQENAYEHFLCRIKEEESMREKCRRMGLPETTQSALLEINDAIGLRIVCNFIDEIYEIVAHLKTFPDITVVKEKDYIKNVKPNGYRSYHMILKIRTPFEDAAGNNPGEYYAEIQLRTIAMDSWAALEHQVKYKKNLDGVNLEFITAELKRCADEMASTDLSMQAIRNFVRAKSNELK